MLRYKGNITNEELVIGDSTYDVAVVYNGREVMVMFTVILKSCLSPSDLRLRATWEKRGKTEEKLIGPTGKKSDSVQFKSFFWDIFPHRPESASLTLQLERNGEVIWCSNDDADNSLNKIVIKSNLNGQETRNYLTAVAREDDDVRGTNEYRVLVLGDGNHVAFVIRVAQGLSRYDKPSLPSDGLELHVTREVRYETDELDGSDNPIVDGHDFEEVVIPYEEVYDGYENAIFESYWYGTIPKQRAYSVYVELELKRGQNTIWHNLTKGCARSKQLLYTRD